MNPPLKILVADDNNSNRKLVKALLSSKGHSVLEATDGQEALRLLTTPPLPAVAVVDWEMPGLEGVEVCRRVREVNQHTFQYIILLTVRDSKQDVVAGLESGADDYLTKPFDTRELVARVSIGVRMVQLNFTLAQRVAQLEEAASQIKQLRGLLPICSYCKRIRDDQNYWQQVEKYIAAHTQATFTHGICPDCYQNVVERPRLPA